MATLDLVVLRHWPGFVRQADLCIAVLPGERSLLPQFGRRYGGTQRQSGELLDLGG